MKSNALRPMVAGAVAIGLIALAGANVATAQTLDPQTGLPVSATGPATDNLASGLPGTGTADLDLMWRTNILDSGAMRAESAAARGRLQNVIFLNSERRYEEALQQCLASQSQTKTEFESQQLFAQWAELGRNYPPAEQALRKIRDEDARQISDAGGGSLVLFSELACLNRLLHEDAATSEVFKKIAGQNPPLARYYYPVAEDSLLSQGEYSLCLSFMGDPRKRFETYRGSFLGSLSAHESAEELAKESPWLPALPDSKPACTNGFVEHVCKLVDFLGATGNRADAEEIVTQTVAMVGRDARLSTALNAAEENIREHRTISLPTGLTPYVGDHAPTEGSLCLANGTPTKAIHYWPPLWQVPVWTAKGQYDKALSVIMALANPWPRSVPIMVALPEWTELARIYPPAKQAMYKIRDRDTLAFEQSRVLPESFGRIVKAGHAPPPLELMAQVNAELDATPSALFAEVSRLNEALGETNATYEMCRRLERQNPAQFQARFYLMEPLLMQHGDYQLCLKLIGDPQANLAELRTNWEYMQTALPRMRAGSMKARQDMEQTMDKHRLYMEAEADQKQQFDQEMLTRVQQLRLDLWSQMRTNLPDADEMTVSPPPNFMPMRTNLPPRLVSNLQLPPLQDPALPVTNFFVTRACVLVDVLVASGHKADAEKIRDEALLVVNDPRLQSAITDAEQK